MIDDQFEINLLDRDVERLRLMRNVLLDVGKLDNIGREMDEIIGTMTSARNKLSSLIREKQND